MNETQNPSVTRQKLTLRDWASIAEVFGAVAVVVSLVFVGLEVRDNTNALQSAVAQRSVDSYSRQQLLLASDPAFADLYKRGRDGGELSDLDEFQLARYAHYHFSNWEIAYFNYLDGLLEPEVWGSWDKFFRYLMTLEFMENAWNQNTAAYSVSFSAYVNEEVIPTLDTP